MKKVTLIITAIILSAFLNVSYAGNDGEAAKTVSVSGTVKDKISQEAIAGALVKIDGTSIEVYTDLDGNFTIEGIIPDTYKIKCSMISYNDREEEIEIDQTAAKLEIELQNLSVK
jgi:hypothetical protein